MADDQGLYRKLYGVEARASDIETDASPTPVTFDDGNEKGLATKELDSSTATISDEEKGTQILREAENVSTWAYMRSIYRHGTGAWSLVLMGIGGSIGE